METNNFQAAANATAKMYRFPVQGTPQISKGATQCNLFEIVVQISDCQD